MTKLVLNSFMVPEEFRTADFLIRILLPRDTELDYAAVMSSIEIIKKTRGGDWPDPAMTLEQDRTDLEWHESEYNNRTSYAYTVLSPDASECLGCFYFYPPGFRSEASKDADVDVSFWVTQSAYDKGLYPVLHEEIVAFLTRWPFEKVVFTNILIP